MSLSEIGVKVEGVETPTGVGRALLSEIASQLERLARAGEEAAIDLSSLPMNDADRSELAELLGRGEIEVHIRNVGVSEIYETRYAGVWWATHRGDDGTVLTERIEVTSQPEMLRSHPDDISAACEKLHAAIENHEEQE